MTNGVKTVIAIGVLVVTTQAIGFILGKKLMKYSEEAFEAFNSSPEEESPEASFVDVE